MTNAELTFFCRLLSRPGKCLLEVKHGRKILEIASEIALLPVGEVVRVDGVDILKGEIFDVNVPVDNQLLKGRVVDFTPLLRRFC
jgi:hypothetical protein